MDELKRVSADRDDYKKKFEAAEKAKYNSHERNCETVRASMLMEVLRRRRRQIPSASIHQPHPSNRLHLLS